MSGLRFIELEGVRVHNLRNISVKIRHNSLTVLCGVSGSGKSSLAFDTLYAEGQRRYIETFSPSARQFLDRIERPDADHITGLPPAIAIRQQLRADGIRATVGTRAEVLDPLRVILSKAGQLFCPDCQVPVVSTSPETAAAEVVQQCDGSRILIVAEVQPDVEQESPDLFRHSIDEWIRQGFTRAIVDRKTVRLEELNTSVPSTLRIVVDRLKADPATEPRIAEAITTAMRLANGLAFVLTENAKDKTESVEVDGVAWQQLTFSNLRTCTSCRRVLPELTPELLSFSSPLGACPDCKGTGLLSTKTDRRRKLEVPTTEELCATCSGQRLNHDAASVRWADLTLPQLGDMELSDLQVWLQAQFGQLPTALQTALRSPMEHAQRRLTFLTDCGLAYLSLNRSMKSLSGGEAQRVMLTSALGSGLINTLYVLDEPTAGLHASDTEKIIASVRRLQSAGNTVVVVEHDPAFIAAADVVIEIGPGAGDGGGTIVFQGTPAELLAGETLTGQKMRSAMPATSPQRSAKRRTSGASRKATNKTTTVSSDESEIVSSSAVSDRKRREPEQWLDLQQVRCHNIDSVDVVLPLGVFCAVIGPSGSGKSSLISDALYPALCHELKLASPVRAEGTIHRILGAQHIENVLLLDQSPVQRSRRSIPATWIGVFDDIRILLAETHEGKKRNYSRAMFSFNASSGGRCPVCEGRGVVTVAMQFLADIETVCEECHGRRFRPEVIEIRYRDRSVSDILDMTADEAFTFFNGHHRIQQRLNAVRQSGLGYLRLGQPLSTVSGGEAQRLRIAAMLAGVPLTDGDTAAKNRQASQLTRSGRTLFLLDEPSSGLHLQDIDRLLNCIDFLLQMGHSVIVIDHDEFLTSRADWHIEMGPGAGKLGGRIVRSGRN